MKRNSFYFRKRNAYANMRPQPNKPFGTRKHLNVPRQRRRKLVKIGSGHFTPTTPYDCKRLLNWMNDRPKLVTTCH